MNNSETPHPFEKPSIYPRDEHTDSLFKEWLKSAQDCVPTGGMQGEGAKDNLVSLPDSINSLPCGCKFRKLLLPTFREIIKLPFILLKQLSTSRENIRMTGIFNEIPQPAEVRITYWGNVHCQTCGKYLGQIPSQRPKETKHL